MFVPGGESSIPGVGGRGTDGSRRSVADGRVVTDSVNALAGCAVRRRGARVADLGVVGARAGNAATVHALRSCVGASLARVGCIDADQVATQKSLGAIVVAVARPGFAGRLAADRRDTD